ncbi:hypothetical protein [Citricoccus sp. GCM10030269]|uniref:hypothetical protein n=1 Tax=Citricoccus sp. GCM10030269 TaxID=3273388 RepID=UPI00361D4675
MDILPGLLGMVLAVACLWWSWFFPAHLVGADWYGTFMSRVFLYLIPSMALLWLFVAADSFLDALGTPWPNPVFDTGAVVLFLVLLLSFVGILGVPLPAPWAPRWMRERRARNKRTRRELRTKGTAHDAD